MTPRPIEPPRSRFEQPLRLALQGRFGEAMELIEAQREAPDHTAAGAADALAQVARLAESGGDHPSAERALELALRERPGHADLHFQRGCVLLRLQRRADARRAFERALEINPRYAAARLERALLDAREGLLGEALAALRQLSDDSAVEEPGAFQQGLKRLEQAEWEEAQVLFQRALRLTDVSLQQQLRHANALLEQGEAARALQALRDVIGEHPAYPDLHALLGRTELALGHFDDAVPSFGRALELNPDFHDARVDLARALEGLGMRTQATEQVALVLESDPAHAMARELRERWSAARHRGADRENAAPKRS